MFLKTLTTRDSKDISYIHMKSFDGFFLTSLGYDFLKFFYKTLLLESTSIKVGLYIDNKLIGFAIGSQRRKSFYKKIIVKNIYKYIFFAIKITFSKPMKMTKLFSSFFSYENANLNIYDDAILLSICLDPLYSSKGFGSILLKEFEETAFQYSNKITLTTAKDQNEIVNNFYIKNGYKVINSFNNNKRKLNFYIKNK